MEDISEYSLVNFYNYYYIENYPLSPITYEIIGINSIPIGLKIVVFNQYKLIETGIFLSFAN